MPSLFFDVQEVEETKTGKVNKSGYLYVGRKHKDKEIIWIKLKECKKKIIYNPVTNTDYEVRSKSSKYGVKGEIVGMWDTKKQGSDSITK